jgi:hypothetical protein
MKCSVIKKLLFILIFWLVGANVFSANVSKETLLYNFAGQWLRYDKYYESYLPLKKKELKRSKSIHQILDYSKFKNYDLKFKATQELTLFVNNKLIYKKITPGEEEIIIPLRTLEPDESDRIIITFFHPSGELPFYSAGIVNRSAVVMQKKEERGQATQFLYRSMQNLLSGYTILFLIIVTLFVLLKQLYPKEFLRYFGLRQSEAADHLLPGPFSIPSLWMALLCGLALSQLIYMFKLDEIIFASSTSILKGTLLITVVYFVFYIGKYLYLWLIGWLFNYSKIVPLQFADYTGFLERVCMVACLVIFGIVASGFILLEVNSEILYFALILVLIFCVIKVILLFLRLIPHRNLYLFSYLCAAEILPLIIAVKILLF